MSSNIWFGNVEDPDFEPYEAGRVVWLRRDEQAGRTLWAGIWEVGPDDLTPGSLHESAHDETFHILEGRIRLEIDGEVNEFGAGSIVSLRKGTKARWTILELTREFFVYVG
jgi:uncharacterized cupin superfamily protein